MARNYDIDVDTFYADPEHYRFSEEEIRALNARELEDYEFRVPMTPAEKRALRKWVASGHSVGESPGSKYICDLGMDFLDVYRADHDIAAAIRGKTRAEKNAYIKEYTGYVDPTPEERERMDAIRNTPVYVQKKYKELSRKLFLLWEFLAEEGLYREAREYLEDHKDDEMPMDFSFILE
jgi:hypothetical protein